MNETLTNLTTRKSPDVFDGTHVSREDIDQIVAAGLNAPSGMNMQDPLFVVVQDEDVVAKLEALNAEAMKAQMAAMNPDAPAPANMPAPFHGAKDVIAVVSKASAFTKVQDGSLAMGNMMNAAWSLGIDSRWIHRAKEVFATDAGKAILAQAGITEEVEGIGFCLLGHAAQDKPQKEINEGRVFYL